MKCKICKGKRLLYQETMIESHGLVEVEYTMFGDVYRCTDCGSRTVKWMDEEHYPECDDLIWSFRER